MRNYAIAAVAALVAALGAQEAPATFEVALKSNPLARGVDLTVGELCDLTPVTPDALAIAKTRFGPAPVPGFARTISRSDVLQVLVAAGHAAADFRFRGANEALVQAVAVEVSGHALVDAATEVLQALLQLEGGDAEFEVVGTVRALQAPPGHRGQDLRARVRGGATGQANAVVDVQVLVDGEVARTVPVQFRLTRFQQVLKVSATVRAGDPLGPHNLEMSREKLTNVQGLYLTGFDQVDGMVARRNLQPNRLLTLPEVAAPALIHRGDLVTAVLTQGRMKVEVRCVANHDAARGERITVTNAQSRAQITGIAEASGTVVVRGTR